MDAPPNRAAHNADRTLVERALAGNEVARAELTRRAACIEGVVAHRNRRLGHPLPEQELADVCQDALEVFWRRLDTFEGRAAIETWIYRIACNVHLATLRRHARNRLQRLPEEGLSAPRPVQAAEELGALHRGLARLASEDEELLRMRHYDALSFVEIAGRLGLSPSGIKHRYRLALERLRQAMRESQLAAEPSSDGLLG
jgi:RNA polymerase sigma-70 factor (ECF subfamily)